MLREDIAFSFVATKAVLSSKSISEIPQYLGEQYSKNPKTVRKTRGFTIFLNPDDLTISSSIAYLGFWQIGVTRLFEKFVKRGTFVVDVGANIGWFTLVAWKLGATVWSFEPEPLNFQLLTKQLKENKATSVKPFQVALSDSDGTGELFLSESANRGAHSLVRGGDKSIRVQKRMLDSLVNTKIDLLKVDVEGAEPLVILGATRLLNERKISRIVMEWNPESWVGKNELLDDLFTQFDVDEVVRTLPWLKMRRVRKGALPDAESNFLLTLK